MSRTQIKNKKHHLLWDTVTREIILDQETDNPNTVTECWREGVEGGGFDTVEDKEKKIKDEKLKPKKVD